MMTVLGLWSFVLGFVPRARAHDPYESFTLVTVRADALELTLTIAQATALKLIDPPSRIAGLTGENFPEHRPRLAAVGREMFTVTSATQPLAARNVTVELTEENDVTFKIDYPRPTPGRLRIHAAFLRKLGPDYGGILDSTDAEGRQLGWEQISWENPNLEITVPSPSSKKK
ncbi:MAG: hypothetical protein HZA93_06575 [Verrucomicrobia bacterium]|nr:hypothetical protein [Verrucomicrobiota bacterium]